MARKRSSDVLSPEQFLAVYPAGIQQLAAAVTGLIQRTVPEAAAQVRMGWQLVGFRTSPEGRYFAYIAPFEDHAMLGFEYGVLLEDPAGLLGGKGSQVRTVRLDEPDRIKDLALAELIRQAAQLAELPLPLLRERMRSR